MSPSTVVNYIKPVKSFREIFGIALPWKIISRFIPQGTKAADDRAPRLDEIQRLIKHHDPRIRPIVLTTVSCGMSIEAWEYLKYGHIESQKRDGKIVAAKMTVFSGKKQSSKKRQ